MRWGTLLVAITMLAACEGIGDPQRGDWHAELRGRDEEREVEIDQQAETAGDGLNPLRLCRDIDSAVDRHSVLVADGGDFVATASYIVKPRTPLSWLDPGVFGTLGVGAGFALGAKLVRPDDEVWVIFGDGAFGYSAIEIDTFVRHKIPVIAVIGNDACWTQIVREQVKMLGDDVGCRLAANDYDRMAQALGCTGLRLDDTANTAGVLEAAKTAAAVPLKTPLSRSAASDASSSGIVASVFARFDRARATSSWGTSPASWRAVTTSMVSRWLSALPSAKSMRACNARMVA